MWKKRKDAMWGSVLWDQSWELSTHLLGLVSFLGKEGMFLNFEHSRCFQGAHTWAALMSCLHRVWWALRNFVRCACVSPSSPLLTNICSLRPVAGSTPVEKNVYEHFSATGQLPVCLVQVCPFSESATSSPAGLWPTYTLCTHSSCVLF